MVGPASLATPEQPALQEPKSGFGTSWCRLGEPLSSTGADGAEHWAGYSVAGRLGVVRGFRERVAAAPARLLDVLSPDLRRTRADSLVAEVLPLLEACRFLERRAARILAPRRLGRSGRPLWLAGIDSVVERVPLGRILVVAPANYPLFLPGVQVMQALAAGNTVTWKPGRGGFAIAREMAALLMESGLPDGVLLVTGEEIDEVGRAIAEGVDKVVFTGSSRAGRAVAHLAAERAIPIIAELSGVDAVVAFGSADHARLADALCFGMRLNGSATCMAPRRLFLEEGGLRRDGSRLERDARLDTLVETLGTRFAAMEGVPVAPTVRELLLSVLAEAAAEGATVVGDPHAPLLRPLLVLDAQPGMRLLATDLFVPVLSVLRLRPEQLIPAVETCPYALTLSVWGERRTAEGLARRMTAGTVLINDVIVPTADPRVPFGGRRGSGYGVTRGADGLLEMTAIRAVEVRRNRSARHFAPTTREHEPFFAALIGVLHGAGVRQRVAALRSLVQAAGHLK